MSSSSSSHHQIYSRNGAIIPWSAIEEFRRNIQGEVLVKGQASAEAYRQAIQCWDDSFVVEAAFVVLAESEADVAACLQFVQIWDQGIAVGCGRQMYSGASTPKGLVVDLGRMRHVSIDKEGMTITAQGGCKVVDLETHLQVEGLSVVFGNVSSNVNDNLIAARIVVADGSVHEVSEVQNSDLFQGIREGLSSFGVITELTYKVHKQDDVFFGPVIFIPGKAASLIQMVEPLQKIVDNAAGKLVLFFLFKRFPGASKLSPGVIISYDGPGSTAKEVLAPLYNLEPIINMAVTRPYAECAKVSPQAQTLPGRQHFFLSSVQMLYPIDVETLQSLLHDLDAFLDKYGPSVGPSRIVFELRSHQKDQHLLNDATDGTRSGIDIILEAHFDDSLDLDIIRMEVKALTDKARVEIARESPNRGLRIGPDLLTSEDKATQTFEEISPRLRELKKKYDAAFVFN